MLLDMAGLDELILLESCLKDRGWMTERQLELKSIEAEMPDNIEGNLEDWEIEDFDKGVDEMIEDGLLKWVRVNGTRWLKDTMELHHHASEKGRTVDIYG